MPFVNQESVSMQTGQNVVLSMMKNDSIMSFMEVNGVLTIFTLNGGLFRLRVEPMEEEDEGSDEQDFVLLVQTGNSVDEIVVAQGTEENMQHLYDMNLDAVLGVRQRKFDIKMLSNSRVAGFAAAAAVAAVLIVGVATAVMRSDSGFGFLSSTSLTQPSEFSPAQSLLSENGERKGAEMPVEGAGDAAVEMTKKMKLPSPVDAANTENLPPPPAPDITDTTVSNSTVARPNPMAALLGKNEPYEGGETRVFGAETPAGAEIRAASMLEPKQGLVDPEQFSGLSKEEAARMIDTMNLIRGHVTRGEKIPENLLAQLPEGIREQMSAAAAGAPIVDESAPVMVLKPNQVALAGTDQFGIPSVPQENSWVRTNGMTMLPLPGGGDIKKPEDFQSFGLKQ